MEYYGKSIDMNINPELSYEERAYEMFKHSWVLQHIDNITMTQTEALYENDEDNNNLHECEDTTDGMSFDEYVEKYGFANGEIYPCYEEFLDNDFEDFLYYPEIEKMIDNENNDFISKMIAFNYRNSQLLGKKFLDFDTRIVRNNDSFIKALRNLKVDKITVHEDVITSNQFDMIGKFAKYGCQLLGLVDVTFYNNNDLIKKYPALLFSLSKPEAVIEVEHANGETYMAFKVGFDKEGKIEVTDTKDCSLADVDGDYIFESDCDLYRVQADEPITIEQAEKIIDDYNDAIDDIHQVNSNKPIYYDEYEDKIIIDEKSFSEPTILRDDYLQIKTTGRDYDFIASVQNKTDKPVHLIFDEEVGVDVDKLELDTLNWFGILANDNGYRMLEALVNNKFSKE